MFTLPDYRLSAANKTLLACEAFFIPIALQCEARTSPLAFETFKKAFDDLTGFVAQIASTAPGLMLLPFADEAKHAPSNVSMQLAGKDYRFHLTITLRCPVPKEKDFWERVRLVAYVYDRLAELAAGFQDRKGVDLSLDPAQLDSP
jgi:hypothetical protein